AFVHAFVARGDARLAQQREQLGKEALAVRRDIGVCRRHDQRSCSLGSRTWRSPSWNRFRPNTSKMVASPGNSATCGAISIALRLLASIAPHSGSGACAPSPRKLRLAAVRIEIATRRVIMTNSVALILGNTWRHRMRGLERPAARAA